MNNANRVITNTAVSYVSLIIRMLMGFFTVRFVLKALGETDYGVYVIVAGVVGMLDILNTNMSNTSMRFFAHSLGSNDENHILKTFNTTVYLHYLVGILTIFILEIGGWCMFEWVLNIPADRLHAAHIIYQFMVATTFITIIAVPYDAVMNAHEHIYILSLYDILSGTLLLICAIGLIHVGGDRLILYGAYMFLIRILLRILKVSFAKKHYSECAKLRKDCFDRELFKSIVSFTGWNLFSSLAALGAGQFRSLIVNKFFGVKLNASEGVSGQVTQAVNGVVVGMTNAINPQIMKSEGGGNRNRMLYLVELGAKYSLFLFALIGIPLFFELPYLLELWLEDVPEYSVIFCRIVMICMLVEKCTFQITHAIRAVGVIRNFQVTESMAFLCYLPFAYFAFLKGMPPVTIYYLSLCTYFIIAMVRFYFGKKIAGINILSYLKNAVFSVAVPIMLAGFSVYVFVGLIPSSIFRAISTFLLFWVIYIPSFLFVCLKKDERNRWKDLVNSMIYKFKKR